MSSPDTGGEPRRELGLFSAAALVVASMIGTGVFTTSGFIMAELGDPRVLLLCWLAGGLFALCGALCYGELGAAFPRAGGEYAFLRESFGPVPAFLSGWISLIVGFSAPIAAAAIAFSAYLFQALPLPQGPEFVVSFRGLEMLTVSPRVAAALATVALISALHCASVPLGARVQNWLTLFKVALIMAFIAAGLATGSGSWSHLEGEARMSALLDRRFAVSLIFVSFAYSGWNGAAYLGAEIRRPGRNIPLALLLGTGLVTVLYLLINLVYLYALHPRDMSGVLEVGMTSAAALFGENAGRYFSAAVALGLVSSVSAMVMAGPRVYFAMARDGVFFSRFGRLSERGRTPAPAVALQAAIASAMILTASFDDLLIYIGFTLSLSALLTVAGLMVLRHRRRLETSGYRTFGYPLTPLLFILGNGWIILFSLAGRPAAGLAGLITIGAGLAVHGLFARSGKTGRTR